MSYATQEQFIEAFPTLAVDLTNLDDPAAGSVDVPELRQALNAATAEIDLYLKVRYSLPLAPESIPEILVQWCRDIARYRLDRTQPDDDVRVRYEDSIKGLGQVASGDLDLFSGGGEGGAQAIARERSWDSQNLSGFGVS